MDSFTPQGSVHENVKELRGYLGLHDRHGTRKALLPRDELAAMIRERHDRELNGSTVQRWEDQTEPDLVSIAIMADLAETTFEEFALGQGGAARFAVRDPTASGVLVAVPAPRRGLGVARPTRRRKGQR